MKEKSARDPLGAFAGFVLGIAFLAVAVVLLGWVVLTKVETAKGFDVAMWAAQHSPIPLPVDPVEFGNRVINSPSIWFIAAFGVMALMAAFTNLWGARLRLRPEGVSNDGEARLELKGAPARVGGSLEGVVVLDGKAAAGDRYKLLLQCRDREGKGSTSYSDSIEVRALPGAGGAILPFRFDIPLTALPLLEWGPFRARVVYEWELLFMPVGSWFGSTFPLQVEPGPVAEVRAARAAMPPAVVGPFPWKIALGVVGGLLGVLTLLFLLVDALISFFRGTVTP